MAKLKRSENNFSSQKRFNVKITLHNSINGVKLHDSTLFIFHQVLQFISAKVHTALFLRIHEQNYNVFSSSSETISRKDITFERARAIH
jgi:hypothetical protein